MIRGRLSIILLVALFLPFAGFGQILTQGWNATTLPASGWSGPTTLSGNSWSSGTYFTAQEGARYLHYTYNSSQPANTWMFSPGVVLTAGVTYTLNFYAITNGGTTYLESYKMTWGTAASVAAQTNVIVSRTNVNRPSWTLETGTFTVPSTGTYYLAVNCFSSTDRFYLGIDNISVCTPLAANSGAASVCVGSTTGLTNASGGGTWASSNVAIATVNSASGLVGGVAAGSVNMTYSNACGTSVSSMNVVSTPSSLSASPSSATICSSGSAQLLTATGGTYTGSGTGSVTVSSGAINVTVPTSTTPGISTINVSGVPAGATVTGVSVNFNIGSLASAEYQSDCSFNLRGPNNNRISLTNNHGANSTVNFVNVTISSASTHALGTANLSNDTWKANLVNGRPTTVSTTYRSNQTAWSGIWGTPNGAWSLLLNSSYNSTPRLTSWSITINYSYPTTLQAPITWTPVSGLYTDAGATTAYVAGTPTATVYARPASNTVYQASVGCGVNSNNVNITANPPYTITANTSNPAVAANANLCQSSTNNRIHAFSLVASAASGACNSTLTQITVPTSGSYVAGDVSNMRLWYNTTNNFASATNIKTIAAPATGTQTFSALSQTIVPGTTYYFWVTTDITAVPTSGATIIGGTMSNANFTFSLGGGASMGAGSYFAGGTQTIGTPTDVSVSGGGVACTNTTLIASGGTPGTMYWQNTTSGGTSTATATSSQLVSSSNTYYFRSRGSNGCWSKQGSATVTINPAYTISASSTNPAVPANANRCESSTNNQIQAFALTASAASGGCNSTLTQVTVPTSGTYAASDVVNFKLWYNTVNNFATASVIGTVAAPATGTQTFGGLTTTIVPGNTYYFWVTTDISATPTSGATITGSAMSNSNFTFTLGGGASQGGGTYFAGGTQTIGTPGDVSVSGGGAVCGDATLNASGGAGGIMYWQDITSGGTSVSTASSSQLVSSTNTYYFRARSASGCWSKEGSATVTVTPLPALANVTGGGAYCAGGAGVAIGLDGSEAGVQYVLGRYSTGGTPVATVSPGAGGAFDIDGAVTTAGTYTVVASYTSGLACATQMTGSVSVSVTSLPDIQTVTGGGTICDGGAGLPIGISASQANVQYEVGNAVTGSVVATVTPGVSPTPIDLIASESAAGTYTVVASNVSGLACPVQMNGNAVINTYPVPSLAGLAGSNEICFDGGSSQNVPYTYTSAVNGADQYTLTWSPAGPTDVSSLTAIPGGQIEVAVPAGTAEGSYTGTLTLKNSVTGCTSTTNIVLQINRLPSVAVSLSPNPACVGNAIALNGNVTGGYGYSLSWSGPVPADIVTPTSASASIASVALADEGDYTLSAIAPTCAGSSSDMASLAVNELPLIGAVSGSPDPACVGGTISLSANVSGGNDYTLLWTHATATIDNSNTTSASVAAITTSDAGVYTITASAPGCGNSNGVTSSIVVNAPPAAVVPSALPNPACVGDNVAFAGGVSGGTALTYAWSGPGGTAMDDATVLNATISSPGVTLGNEGVYTLNVTAAGCAPVSGNIALAVNQLPSLSLVSGAPDPACVGGTISLSANVTGGNDYTLLWTHASATINDATLTDANVTSVASTDAGIYTLTASADGCGSTSGTTSSIVVNTPPTSVAPVISANPACVGDNVSLTGNVSGGTALSYLWSGPGGTLLDDALVEDATVSAPGVMLANEGTYTLTATAAGCAGVSGTTYLEVNQLPSITAVSGSPDPACIGGTISLSATVSGGDDYSLIWTHASATINDATMSSANVTSVSPSDAGVYTLTASALGCAGSSDGATASIVVNTPPTSVLPSVVSPVCSGDVVSFTGNVSGGTAVSYTWNGPGGTAFDNSLLEDATITGVVLANDGVYTLSATADGCAPVEGTTSLVVNQLPSLVTASVSPDVNCVGSSVDLAGSATGGNGYVYTWGGPNMASIADPTQQNTGIAAIDLVDAGVYTLTVSAPGCSGDVVGLSTSLVVNPTPLPIGGNGPICANGVTLGLSETATGGTWSSDNTSVATVDENTGLVTSVDAGTANVSYVNGGLGCVQSVVVTVNPRPDPTFIVFPGANSCEGSGVTYTTQAGQSSYVWSVPGTAGFDYTVTSGGLSSSDNTVTLTWHTLGDKVVTVGYADPVTFCSSVTVATNTTTVSALPASVVVTDANLPPGGPHCGSTTLLASNGNDGIIYFQGQTSNGISTATPSVSQLITNSGTSAFTRTYYFRAQSVAGCWGPQGSLAVTLNPTPTPQTVTMSNGGVYCTGGTGVTVGIANSQVGVNYQLYVDGNPTGSPVAGNNGPRDFGLQTLGTYSVTGTYSTSPFCSGPMLNSVVVTEAPIPTVYTLSGGGSYCAGSTGINNIELSSSQVGVTYRLLNGITPVGSDVPGTGAALNFATEQGVSGYTTAGNYTVVGNPTSPCATTMSGVATVSVSPAPSNYVFSGDNTICAGDAGVTMYLSGSQSGVNYQLYRDGVAMGIPKPGTGFMLTFTGLTAAGTYSVLAQHGTSSCENQMTGTAVLTVLPQPTQYIVSGTGSYCQGGTGVDIQLSNTQSGVDYSLYRDGSPTGTVFSGNGSAHTFAGQTAAGVYTVRALNTGTGCTNTMSGSATVTINALPVVYSATGGGSYCQGQVASIGMGMSFSSTGATYTLYGPSGLADGPVAGTGGAFSFANQGALGSYTVVATSVVGGCMMQMNGHPAITQNSLPAAFNISAGGSYCSGGTGVELTLDGSQGSTSYQLYRGATATGAPVSGTGSAISLGNQTTAANNYIIVATGTSTLCSNTMTGVATVTVTPLPTAYAITGTGSACAGAGGVAVSIANTQAGVNYELYKDGVATGTILNGNGSGQSFGNQLVGGSYTAVATNTLTSCTNTMSGSATVTINALPNDYAVTGGGTVCAGGTGVNIGLSGSQSGVEYRLYIDGVPTGSPVGGTGFALSFGTHNTNGTYTIGARNTTTNCTLTMSTSVNVTANPLPAAQLMSGGGSYCAGGTGVLIGLQNSQTGVTYELYLNGNPTGQIQPGNTGNPVSFGLQTATGIYTVGATSGAGCTGTMTGNKTISLYAQPTVYTVTGGGGYCPSGSGVVVGLNGSQSGASYQLVLDGVDVPLAVMSGTGTSISFGLRTAAGVYTVRATSADGCSQLMNNSATVSIYPLPTAYTLSGSGSYCAGGTGIAMTLSGSQGGVNYQLFLNGNPQGSPVGGSGFALALGNQAAAGNYTMSAINATTGCVNAMNGTGTVTVNALPVVYAVGGGGSYCQGGTGVDILLANTEADVNYTLLRNGISTGIVYNSAGTGAHTFTGQTVAGNYTVAAQNAITGCTSMMSGSATVSINSLPVQYTVTGGGNYCAGGTGVNIGLNNTATGTNYQLRNESGNAGLPLAGTGSAISFGLQTATGTYSVMATNTTTGCTNDMANTVSVGTNPLPTGYTVGVTGGGLYCQGGTGVHVTLSNSQAGVNYQLYSGSAPTGAAMAGTGASLDFGLHTAGTYSVSATNATTTCSNGMTGGATIATTPLPTAYNVTGTGSYCAGGTGVAVGLDNSENNFQYQLYRGATLINTQTGTGAAITFGDQTTAGTYTVLATNNVTGCQKVMSGSATITVDPLPLAHAMNGGGAYCATGTGVHVGLSTSTTGISYQLYSTSGASGSALVGTGSGLDFGLQTTAGSYTVLATNTTTGCMSQMSGHPVVTINAQPVLYDMTGGGGYCQGGAGMPVGLSGSELGLSYQLFIDGVASGTPATGTGASLNFGIRTIAGTYTIVANNTTTGCSRNMNGSAVIIVNPLPALHTMTGGGSYCNGGSGVAVGLGSSTVGIDYQLYNGAATVGSPVGGTGASISFGTIAAAGTYTVLATDATTGCTRKMNGSATVSINPLPTVYAVSGGGAYCQGGTGVHVGMVNTEAGMSYQLYYNGTPSGAAVMGTGTTIDFGLRTAAGTYTVKATNPSTACVNDMSGGVIITINALPTVRTVTGGGAYCAGGTGVAIGLNNSSTNTTYQLYNGSTATATASGTGTSISFGLQTAAGTYTVAATDLGTGCKAGMNGSATVTINALPVVYAMTGGGSYCNGGSGVAVGLSGSQSGMSYQLYNGSGQVGAATAGTGSAINFGSQLAAGTYSVTATNAATTCAANMSGNATVTINAVPNIYDVTGGGTACSGAGGVPVTLNNSENGVSYQLYRGSAAIGGAVAGTGSGITFGNQTASGTYSVSARNTSTLCYSDMNGAVTVTITALPLVQTVTGGGSLCNGGSGVSIGLANTENGITYELYRGSTPVTTMTGTGGAISFTAQAIAGTYSVLATNAATGCTQNMLGSALVTVNSLPVVYAVTASGTSYCAGGTGIAIGVSNSESNISYQLYRNGSAVGSGVAGTGTGAITFGNQLSAGTYTVAAINNTTGCRSGMSNSATISIDALPIVYPVSGGGSYCQGEAGVDVSVLGSEAGITYILLQNGNPVLTLPGGSPVDFGVQTAGTYTIRGVSAASCSSMMSGTAVITENALPAVYDVTGGGAYCQGGAGMPLGLSGSQTGVSYQLLANNIPSGLAKAGTGFALSFGPRLAATTYTVRATNTTTGCTTMMNLTQAITINTPPTVYAVTGGGSYCQGTAGVAVGVSGSDNNTVTYSLYNGNTLITQQNGTTTSIDFGVQPQGSYTVKATDGNGCMSDMSGIATVTMNTLPTAYAMSGGGSYCQGNGGIAMGLANSDGGVSYQLYNAGGAIGASVAGTNGAISFGNQVTAGSYTVVATNTTTGCMQQMSSTAGVVINIPPTVQNVTGGGSYCQGSTGITLGLSNTETGVSYQLYNGMNPVGAAQAGTNNPVSFGAQAAGGNYNVIATNTTTGCTSNMNGTPVISVNTLPTVYNIGSSAGSYCAGSGGVAIALSGSQVNTSYQLQVGGAPTGAPLQGTGNNLDFGMHMAPGLYTVVATSNITGCSNMMSNPVNVSINPLPAPLPVSGGGSYCQGGTGVQVGMSTTEPGIRYELYLGSVRTATVTGTGAAVNFGLQTGTGTYQVLAINTSTLCSRLMPGTAVVSTNTLPSVFSMDGGGSYCQGGAGVEVKLSGSQAGISYQLYNGGIATGTPLAGTGNAISFGLRTASGSYAVVATNNTTACAQNMSGAVSVNINATPTAYTVTGGGGYCSGGTGVHIGVANSQGGVSYQLYNAGGNVGTAIVSAGGSIDFGLQATAGTYSVQATNSSSCAANMSGTAVVNINSLPNVYNVTGGGSYCSGSAAPHVMLSGSQVGLQYQLYRDAVAVGAAVNGTGAGIDFGAQVTPGVYSAYAVNPVTTCNANMSGSVSVIMNTTVVPDVTILVSPNDTVCAGTNVMYTALATNGGTAPAFEWKVNGFSVGVSSTYNYVPTDGDLVTVSLASSAVCASPSAVNAQVTMTVRANVTPQVSVTKSTADTVCAGTVVTYTAHPINGGTTPGYQWLLNGNTTPSTSSTWNYAPVAGDIVSVVLTSNEACRITNTAFSNPVSVEIGEAVTPVVTISADPGTHVTKGTSVTLTATVVNGGLLPQYQWYINGGVVPGATQSMFVNSNYNDEDSVTVQVTNNNVCGTRSTFNSVIMHIEGGVSVANVSGSTSDLHLVPNPNRGTFTVKGTLPTQATEEVSYEVTNMLGQVVYQAKAMAQNGVIDQQVQLPGIANGMYMLTLKTTTENRVFHVVVEQ